jgi:hypothetical protein
MIRAIRFSFRFSDSYRLAARPFGIRPDNSWVEVDERRFSAVYGRWLVETPLDNITHTRVTGPYAFYKTAGPARLAVTDRGLTFASNGERGLLICFDRKVWGLDRLGLIRHPELTVTVEDPEALAAAIDPALRP